MSGFTHYIHLGDEVLVYEALHSKWSRHHASHCGCGQSWITAHAEPAGFTVVRTGNGFTTLVGPGLTIGVEENALTTNALWEAVTGKPGTQTWAEGIQPGHGRQLHPEDGSTDADRTDDPLPRPATIKQIDYLKALAAKADPDWVDIEFANAIVGTDITPRAEDETIGRAVRRLTHSAADTLIRALAARDQPDQK